MTENTKNKKQAKHANWKHFITEVLLIVLAINIGLWFNNLNDQWQERQLETRILNELLLSLNSDKADITSNIQTHIQGIQSGHVLLKQDSSSEKIALNTELGYVKSWSFLLADLSTYESLKSIGFLLIRDDDIRRKVTKLYNVDYKSVLESEVNHKRICHSFDEVLQHQYLMNDLLNLQNESNESGLSHSNEKKFSKQHTYMIRQLVRSHTNMQNLYEKEILPNLNDLIARIESALNSRK